MSFTRSTARYECNEDDRAALSTRRRMSMNAREEWSLCMLRKIWWSLVPVWATWFRESSLRKRKIPTPPRRRKIAKWGLRRKMRLSFFYNMTDVFFRSDQRWISPVPKTSFPHTNLGILLFRICENAVPSLYVARRPVTGCALPCLFFPPSVSVIKKNSRYHIDCGNSLVTRYHLLPPSPTLIPMG